MESPSIIDQIPEELLPGTVRGLVEVIGLPAALALVEERGGTWFRVPVRASADHWLAGIIGLPALEGLVRTYAGEGIDLPRCAAAMRALREREIVAELESGVLCRVVAIKYGYTEDGLRKLRRRVQADRFYESHQNQLFAPPLANE